MGWVIFAAVLIPLIGIIAWIALDDSFVRIESGQLGLLLVKGRATKTVLEPGPHWVPALRRRTVQAYPALEMSYRAGAEDSVATGDLERSGPPLRATLSDRIGAVVAYTVRFQLDPDRLRTVHERFGADGIWAAVRDTADLTIRSALAETDVEEVYGVARDALQERLTETLRATMEPLGIAVLLVSLGGVDLGRTGETIEATSRARHELAREQAETSMRLARVRTDADVAAVVVGQEGTADALRYRELDLWRDVARDRHLVVPFQPERPASAESSATPPPTGPESPVVEP